VQRTFSPEPDPGFGIRNAAWHPTGMFIAVGGCDDKVYASASSGAVAQSFQIHILDGLTWSATATLELTSKIAAGAVSI
jgi:WD40 repeat protein